MATAYKLTTAASTVPVAITYKLNDSCLHTTLWPPCTANTAASCKLQCCHRVIAYNPTVCMLHCDHSMQQNSCLSTALQPLQTAYIPTTNLIAHYRVSQRYNSTGSCSLQALACTAWTSAEENEQDETTAAQWTESKSG